MSELISAHALTMNIEIPRLVKVKTTIEAPVIVVVLLSLL